MLTVPGQQHSFSTHERVFLRKCQPYWDRKCLDWGDIYMKINSYQGALEVNSINLVYCTGKLQCTRSGRMLVISGCIRPTAGTMLMNTYLQLHGYPDVNLLYLGYEIPFTMSYQPANWLFAQWLVQTSVKENTKTLHYWPSMRRIYRRPMGDPHMQRAFPCHDVIMLWRVLNREILGWKHRCEIKSFKMRRLKYKTITVWV